MTRVDRVAVGQRPRQRLEHDDAGALAADVAVGAGRRTPCSGRRAPWTPALREVDAVISGDRIRFTPAGQGQRRTRRCRGSGRPGGPPPATTSRPCRRPGSGPRRSNSVGEPVGGDAQRRCRCRCRRRSESGSRHWQPAVVVGRDADEHAGRGPGQPVGGGCPASSSASQATSSSSRCCGSMRAASRGEMPKKAASNRSTCRRGSRPSGVVILPGAAGSASVEVRGVPAVGRDLARRRPRRRAAAARTRPGRRAAGEPAADADDGDRLAPTAGGQAIGRRSGRTAGRGSAGQVAGERLDRRILVDQGRRERAAEPLLQLAGQADRLRPSRGRSRRGAARSTSPGPTPSSSASSRDQPAPRSPPGRWATAVPAPLRRGTRRARAAGRDRALVRVGGASPSACDQRRRRACRPGTPRGRRGAGPCRWTSWAGCPA